MPSPLFRLWIKTVHDAPSASAVIDASTCRRWSRADIARSAEEWADEFRKMVPSPWRRRVLMSEPNGGDWFRVFLGILSAGAIPAPVDPSEPEEAQADAARAVGATHMWCGGRLRAVDRAARPGRIAPGECLVKITSGSSGTPKGLPATYAQMAADGRQVCRTMGIGAGDCNLATIPLGYSYGLGNLVLPLLLQGTRMVCASSVLPHAIAAECALYRPTVFPTVPPVLKALAVSGLERGSLRDMRLVISAGSPLEPGVARAFSSRFGIRVHGFYGTSETGGIAFDRTGAATLSGRGVGTPLSGVRVALGNRGAFTVSGRAVLGNGRHTPADRASLNEHGELVLLGRTDRTVKLAGRRVDLAEIERALKSLPGIRDALAHAGAGANPILMAAVATELPAADIRRMLRLRLASWKVPSRILAVPELPVTARGKTDVRKLRQILSAPRTATSISTLSAERHISPRK